MTLVFGGVVTRQVISRLISGREVTRKVFQGLISTWVDTRQVILRLILGRSVTRKVFQGLISTWVDTRPVILRLILPGVVTRKEFLGLKMTRRDTGLGNLTVKMAHGVTGREILSLILPDGVTRLIFSTVILAHRLAGLGFRVCEFSSWGTRRESCGSATAGRAIQLGNVPGRLPGRRCQLSSPGLRMRSFLQKLAKSGIDAARNPQPQGFSAIAERGSMSRSTFHGTAIGCGSQTRAPWARVCPLCLQLSTLNIPN